MRKFLFGVCALAAAVVSIASPAVANGSAGSPAARSNPAQPPVAFVDANGATTPTEPGTDSDTADTGPVASPSSIGIAPVDFLQVEGLFDEIIITTIEEAIADATQSGSQALVLQVDSQGAVVSDERLASLLREVRDAPVAVAVWVGPTGARLTGRPAQLLAVADVTAMAPGATVGHVGAPVDPSIDLGPGLEALREQTVGLTEARTLNVFKQRISDEGVPGPSNMLYALDGYDNNGVALDTTVETVTDSGTIQRETIAVPRFAKLNLIDQLFHTVASPPVAYLLLLIGLSLIVFEFYTAGIGIAAVVGASCTVLAASGLAALPTRTPAVVMIVVAMIAFAIDVQVGLPRFWTAVGMVLTVIASFTMFAPIGGSSLRPGWVTLVAGIGGVALAFYLGMPLMTRTRFGTQSIDRSWMVGSDGSVVIPLDPGGIVEVEGAEWKATSVAPSGAALQHGDAITVVGVDDITLQVEPAASSESAPGDQVHASDDAKASVGGSAAAD